MAFVVSGGQLGLSGWTPEPAMPLAVRLSEHLYAEYGAIWRWQPQVRTVVSFLSRNIAQLGLHVFRRVSDTDRQRLTDHPMALTLAEPVPGAPVSRYRLIERLVSDLAIYDIAYWAKVRVAGTPRIGLVPLPPPRVQATGGSWLAPAQYRVISPTGVETLVDAANVVVFHGYNPADMRIGTPPMESLRSLLLEEHEAIRSREQMWRRGARMSGFLTRPAGTEWSPKARTRFEASWRRYTADGGAEGGTPILEDGMDYKAVSLTPEQAQYIESRKLTREEVAAAYHIPPPMVGILDHATFSNIKEQHQQLYQDTLGPWLISLAEDIKLQLLPEFGDSDDVYVEFNLAEKMRGSFEEQAAAASTSTGRPWMTVNEQRARFNLPQIDGGDELVVPLNVVTGGLASPRDTAPPKARPGAKSAPGRPRVKADRPDDLGDVDAEANAFAAALATWSTQQLEQLSAAAEQVDEPDLAALWDAGADERVASLQQLVARYGYRLSQVGAWQVLDTYNPEADGWDAEVMLAWVLAAAHSHATQHDEAGRAALDAAAADADDATGWRDVLKAAGATWLVAAARRAVTASTEYASFGGHDAASASGLATKTWRTGTNPRPSHAVLNGQTVPIDDVFGNGLRWPGDGAGDTDETANCNCRVDYARGD